MKNILSLTLAMALMAALFTGCGCAANVSTNPSGIITEEPTRPSLMPTPTATHETTLPPVTTRPHATAPATNGTDPTDGTVTESGSTETTMMPRHRNHTAR